MLMRDYEADLAVCQEATPGPWVDNDEGDVFDAGGYLIAEIYNCDDDAFIALAREALPWYINRVKELEAAIAGVRELYPSRMDEDIPDGDKCKAHELGYYDAIEDVMTILKAGAANE